MLQPLAGLVASIALAVRGEILEFSPDGVSYLGVSLCSIALMLSSLRIQLREPGRWSWAWILAAGAFAGTPLRLMEWPAVHVWPALVLLAPALGLDVWRGIRAGGLMRVAAVLMVAPFVVGYGLGHLPVEGVVTWRLIQAAMLATVAAAATLSMLTTGDNRSCRT